jgi:hypothetical protein
MCVHYLKIRERRSVEKNWPRSVYPRSMRARRSPCPSRWWRFLGVDSVRGALMFNIWIIEIILLAGCWIRRSKGRMDSVCRTSKLICIFTFQSLTLGSSATLTSALISSLIESYLSQTKHYSFVLIRCIEASTTENSL